MKENTVMMIVIKHLGTRDRRKSEDSFLYTNKIE